MTTTQTTQELAPMDTPRRDRGQILVIFAIALMAIVAMVGLVLDGGSAFAQRREEQNVADLAAMAGATAHLNTKGDAATKQAAAIAAANQIALDNRYVADPANGFTIDVNVTNTSFYGQVQVQITRPHRNNFAAVLGMSTWPVSVTATARSSGQPNAAIGAMPLLFNEDAFPGAICDEDAGGCVPEVYQLPGTGNEDVPQDATQFNWTIFCTASGNPCNANSNGVRAIINGGGEATTINLNDDIGPLNAGAHTTLFTALEPYVGGVFPVPVVNDEGDMVGWAYFKLLSTEGASDKVIRGYFVSPVNAEQLIVTPTGGTASLETGVYTIKLTD